jgi:hypothetical protein
MAFEPSHYISAAKYFKVRDRETRSSAWKPHGLRCKFASHPVWAAV